MGVYMDLLVAPCLPLAMTRERFAALILDLLDEELVSMPCAILGGDVDSNHPLGVVTTATFFAEKKEDNVEVYYKGEDSISLLRTLREVPFGLSDLCVWFDHFNWENQALAESFSQRGYYNAGIVLYALAQPQSIMCCNLILGEIGEEYMVQFCLRTAGKSGPWDIEGTPLEPLLKRHFGADLIVDCSYT